MNILPATSQLDFSILMLVQSAFNSLKVAIDNFKLVKFTVMRKQNVIYLSRNLKFNKFHLENETPLN